LDTKTQFAKTLFTLLSYLGCKLCLLARASRGIFTRGGGEEQINIFYSKLKNMSKIPKFLHQKPEIKRQRARAPASPIVDEIDLWFHVV
jgi:hypothetical protein